jgi:hypothetical protein
MTASIHLGTGAGPDTLPPLTAAEPRRAAPAARRTARQQSSRQPGGPRLTRAVRASRRGRCGSRSPPP